MKRKTKDHKTPTLVLFIEKKEHRVKERFSCTCRCPRKWKGPGKDHFKYATRWRSCHGAQRPFWERKHLQHIETISHGAAFSACVVLYLAGTLKWVQELRLLSR